MKIWIINPFDNLPQEGFRAQRYSLMAEALAKRGHETVLWTGDFNHGTKARRVLKRSLPANVRMLKTLPYPKNICLRRVVSHLLLARAWTKAADAERVKPDAIVVSVPPLGLARAAVRWGRQHGIKTVVDIQDAWPETFARVLPGWAVRLMGRVAREIYRGADAISAVADGYLELAREYGAQGPMKKTGHVK
ncbi:MAG: glycosyltransferase [Kiritimatiellae bacterium]|nr:glycosyltransferase [Kiritimatiellia bacterium]